jgi:hypothetical protein
VAQPATHVPLEHCSSGPQRLPHAPQFVGLVRVSMHWLLQLVRPPPHAHAPATQFAPAPHTFLQAPQFDGSAVTSVHAPLQSV